MISVASKTRAKQGPAGASFSPGTECSVFASSIEPALPSHLCLLNMVKIFHRSSYSNLIKIQ